MLLPPDSDVGSWRPRILAAVIQTADVGADSQPSSARLSQGQITQPESPRHRKWCCPRLQCATGTWQLPEARRAIWPVFHNAAHTAKGVLQVCQKVFATLDHILESKASSTGCAWSRLLGYWEIEIPVSRATYLNYWEVTWIDSSPYCCWCSI